MNVVLTSSSSFSISSRFPAWPYVGMSPRARQNSDVALSTIVALDGESGSFFTIDSNMIFSAICKNELYKLHRPFLNVLKSIRLT